MVTSMTSPPHAAVSLWCGISAHTSKRVCLIFRTDVGLTWWKETDPKHVV
jgi:hypothetical protein